MDFVITAEQLLWIFGAIGTIGGAVTVIYKLAKPLRDKCEKIDENEKAIVEAKKIHKQDIEEIRKDMRELSEMSKLQCKCSFALISHEISGNSIDKLKDAKDELEKHLIEK